MDNVLTSPEFSAIADELATVVRECHARGWTPARSSNFSARFRGAQSKLVAISKTGLDKTRFAASDLMVVDVGGQVIAPRDGRPSAETLLHTAIYTAFPRCKAVLHTHSPGSTVISMRQGASGRLSISGLEILKGLRGNNTHECTETVPIFRNTQDMIGLAAELREWLSEQPETKAFLIAGHGVYTWGESVAEAWRHLEVFEFLFEVMQRL